MQQDKIQQLLLFVAAISFVVVAGPFIWDAVKKWFFHRKQALMEEQYKQLQDLDAYDLALMFRKRLRGAVISEGNEKEFVVVKDGNRIRWECDGIRFNWDVFSSTIELFSTTIKMENYDDYVPVKIFLKKTETFKIVSIE